MSNIKRKGIILAGGIATRLYPITKSVSKQLMPVYDKPMIYYPLSTLMMSGIRDILIITRPDDQQNFRNLLGNGDHLGLSLSYKIQKSPDGIAQSFLIGKDFLKGSNAALILGDNIFYGPNLETLLEKASMKKVGATVFSHEVENPKDYGVIEFKNKKIISIEEKPKYPKSNQIITGLYYYDDQVVDYAQTLKPSKRGELEITDINNIYLNKELLDYKFMNKNFLWLDTGTHDSLLNASNLILKLQKEKKIKICCPEEISFRKKWISANQLNKISDSLIKTNYGKYLKTLVEES